MVAKPLELAARDVEVSELVVRFGTVVALDRVSFTVERGRVLAVVGANGAGKSTLFRALLGLLPLAAGDVRIFGRSPATLAPAERAKIAYVSERHAELAHQRIGELARFRAAVYPSFDATFFVELARELHLDQARTLGELSRGQRAAAVVSLALAQRPELLLLDDPTLGLDPLARRRIIQAVLGATRERELSVVIATHELSDVERVADDLVLLARGRGSAAIELEHFVGDACAVDVPATGAVEPESLAALDGVLHVWRRRREHQVVIRGDAALRAEATAAIARLAKTELAPRPVSFEELALAWLATKEAS